MGTTTQVTSTPPPFISQTTTTLHLRAPPALTSTMSTPEDRTANTPSDTLTCKACTRTLCTISAEGELVPAEEQDNGCDLCEDMMTLYSEYEENKEIFAELQHRRPNYGPRGLALEVLHESQMMFGNFIFTVAYAEDAEPEEESEEQTEVEPVQDAAAQPRRRKRCLSPQSSSSPGQRRPAKRPRLSDGSGRRVGFDDSVVFHDVDFKRTDEEFNRKTEGYSPGRHAAPDGSEWLDTSGCSMKETQFFGVKKQGQGWVATKEGLELDEEWASMVIEEDVGDEVDDGGEGEEEVDEDEGMDLAAEIRRHRDAILLTHGAAHSPAESSELSDPDASDQESPPNLEPSSRAGQDVGADQGGSSDGDAARDDIPLPVRPIDQASAKEESCPDDDEILQMGLAWTDKVTSESQAE